MKSMLGAMTIIGTLLTSAADAATSQPRPSLIELYPQSQLRQPEVPEVTDVAPDTGEINIRNVSVPALQMFAPAPGKANGAAVIVAPGGGFFTLVYDNEGTVVAQRLAEQGFTAFVLKYRVVQTPAALVGMPPSHEKEMNVIMARAMTGQPAEIPRFDGETNAIPDAARAVRILRERAPELHIDPKRIGFVGFSAGAFLAVDIAIGEKSARPDFIGVIYGALRTPVPSDAPPAFIAVAADDELVPNDALQLFQAWRAAGRTSELHVYEGGRHGFGATQKGTTSDHWLDEFVWWMRSLALLKTGK